ncbi:hypothetical protein [Salinivirga cyanobacteriivorans]
MRITLLSILIALMACSCAIPEDIVRIESTENNIDWLMGKQVVTKNKDSLTIALKYEQDKGAYIFFDTEILNHSSEKVTVSSKNYSIIEINDTSTYQQWIGATDPEEMLLKKDIDISRSIAAQKNAATTSLIIGTALLATDIAMTVSDNDTPQKAATRAATADASYITTSAVHHANVRKENLGYRERAFWAKDVLRKTTLYPGESIRGYVIFPKKNLFDSFEVEIQVGEKSFNFGYNQHRIPANNY